MRACVAGRRVVYVDLFLTVTGRSIVVGSAGDVFAICFFHAQDAVYSLSIIALPPPAGRAATHERSTGQRKQQPQEEKIGRCPHQATTRVWGVMASSGRGP